jgi:heme exporter protein D
VSDIGNFLAMGGYAGYVWPAYGAALVILAAIWLDGVRRRRAVERALAAGYESREDES